MQKVLYSLLVIGMVSSIVVGSGAIAFFIDTEASTGNTFTAATLDIADITMTKSGPGTISTAEDGNQYITLSNLKPGDCGCFVWKIQNTGSLSGSLDVEMTRTADAENTVLEPELPDDTTTDEGELDDYMVVRIRSDLNEDGTFGGTGELNLTGGLATKLPSVNTPVEVITNHPMAAATGNYDEVYIKIDWAIPADVGGGNVNDNIIQSDSFSLKLMAELLQVAD